MQGRQTKDQALADRLIKGPAWAPPVSPFSRHPRELSFADLSRHSAGARRRKRGSATEEAGAKSPRRRERGSSKKIFI